MKTVYLTDHNFDDFMLSSSKIVLVDFWANWCLPCKKLNSILKKISKIFYTNLIIAKINIEENKIIPKKYNIRSIPTLILFNKKKILDTNIGLLSEIQLKNFIRKNL